MRRALILLLSIVLISACEDEADKRQRLVDLVEQNLGTGNDAYMQNLTDEELALVGEILEEKAADLRGQMANSANLTSRMMSYAIEDRAKADALTAECEALFGPYSDPANTLVVADCVDRAWGVK